MKAFLAVVLLFSAFQASASAVLHIPTFLDLDKDGRFVPASVVNVDLRKLGAAEITEFVDVTSQTNASAAFGAIDQQIVAAIPHLNPYYKDATRQWDLTPSEHQWSEQQTCYRGNAAEVADIVAGLADVEYSDQLQIIGWKFQNQSVLNGDYDEEATKELNQKSALWRNWGGQTTDLLILSAVGDDGDDVNESLIPLCK